MAAPQQQQGARVLAALSASMDAIDPSARAAAEAALAAEARQPGFAVVLAHAATARDTVAPELRQMSAVMLKQVVRGRWASGGDKRAGGGGGAQHRSGDSDGDDDDDHPHHHHLNATANDSDEFGRINHGSTLPAGDSDDDSVRMAPRRPGGAGAMMGAGGGGTGATTAATTLASGPPLPEADKAAVRAALPQGLSDPHSKVRTAVGVAVAAIAAHDWPQHWPELLPGLVGAVANRRADPLLAGGALRCLCLLAEDLDEEQKPELARLLADDLRAIVEAGTAAASLGAAAGPDALAALPLRRPALAVWRHLLTGLGTLAGAQHARAVRDLLAPTLPAWTAAVAAVLGRQGGGGGGEGAAAGANGAAAAAAAPPPPPLLADPSEWGVRKEALRVAQALVVYFAKPLAPHLPGLMAGVWRLFQDAAAPHQLLLVEGGEPPEAVAVAAVSAAAGGGGAGAGAADDVDEEGDVMDLEGLLAQLFELLLAVVGSERCRPLVAQALPALLSGCIQYMQITQEQAETWGDDANRYLADEDEDVGSARAGAELLIDEAVAEFGQDAAAALLQAVAGRLREADALSAAAAAASGGAANLSPSPANGGDDDGESMGPRGWRLREAALAALGAGAEGIEAARRGAAREAAEAGGGGAGGGSGGGVAAAAAADAQVEALLADVLARDLSPATLEGWALAAGASSGGGSSAAANNATAVAAAAAAAQHQQQPPGLGSAFLVGRALWLAARYQRHPAGARHRLEFLRAAAAGVAGAGLPPAVRVGACRALAALAPRVPADALRPLLPNLFASLLALLASASDETLHLALETLCALVRADTEVAATHVMALAGPVLEVWARYSADPLVAEDALDVVRALAACPRCLPPLAAAVAPPLAGIISAPAGQHPPVLVEQALDLLGALARPPPTVGGSGAGAAEAAAVAAPVAAAGWAPALTLLRQGASEGDGPLVRGAAWLLIRLLRAGGAATLTWACGGGGGTGAGGAVGAAAASSSPILPPSALPRPSSPEEALRQLMDAVALLLSPDLPEDCSDAAGPLLEQAAKSLPAEALRPALPALVGAAATKLAFCGGARAVAGLLLFFSRLALADPPGLVDLMAGMRVQVPGSFAVGAGGGAGGGAVAAGANAAANPTTASALEVVLPLWLERAGDVIGDLPTKRVAAALLALVLRARHHPALSALAVRGDPLPIEAPGGGRVTRRTAARMGGLRYAQVPAAVRAVGVVGERLAEARERPVLEGGPARQRRRHDDSEDDDDEDDDEEGDGEHDGARHLSAILAQGGAGGAGLRDSADSWLSARSGRAAGLLGLAAAGAAAAAAGAGARGGGGGGGADDASSAGDGCDLFGGGYGGYDGDDMDAIDPADAADPLAARSLQQHCREAFAALAAEDPAFLRQCAADGGGVSQRARRAIEAVMAGQ